MNRSRLKLLRVAAAVLTLAAFLAAFLDLRGALPTGFSRTLASSQLVPALLGAATGAASATALILILAITLLAGRIYCSAVCPLGILQDVIIRARRWFAHQKLLPFRPTHRWTRRGFFVVTVVGVSLGWFGFTLSLLDPYSVFGRIASDLLRPLATYANNWLAAAGNSAGFTVVNRVDVHWAAVGALAFPLGGLAIVGFMATLRGRLYCNTVCPVGTLLGLVSARGAFRLSIDSSSCRKCGDCLRACKAQCLDLRTGSIDASRCVACYNCIAACEDHAIGYRLAWKRKAAKSAPAPNAPAARSRADDRTPFDPQRRAFISELGAAATAAVGIGVWANVANADEEKSHWESDEQAGQDGAHQARRRQKRRGNHSRAIAPPGAGTVDHLLEHCTACHLCVTACPTHVLQPAFLEYGWEGLMKPRMDYTRSYCLFDCKRCTEICPDGALTALTLAQKHTAKIGVAKLDIDKCIVKTHGTDCAACSEHCPTKAVDTKPHGDNLRLPWVHGESCIGCGACEYACPAEPKAIRVSGHQRHLFVRERVEEKATRPTQNGDFPF